MSWSKEKKKNYMKAYYASKKQKLIESLGSCCSVCGSIDSLEMDHIDWREKKFSISDMWAMKEQSKLKKELKKCQLLCSRCHKKKTKKDQREQKTKEPTHGTMYAWQKKKCQCDICLKEKRRWYNERNEKRRSGVRGPRKMYGRPSDHGEKLNYTRGCRCDLCRKANAEYAKSLYKEKNKARLV